MDIRTLQILDRFDEASVQELERVRTSDPVAKRAGFKEAVALFVVLTATRSSNVSETADACAGSSGDQVWCDYYKRICKVFAEITCVKKSMESKSNYGRPLMRQILQQTGLAGSTGDKASLYLWQLMDSLALEVPDTYSDGFSAALLYLVVMDAGTSFDQRFADAVEIPCFLQMFRHSSRNNANSLCALLSEYLALIRVCRFENYLGERFWYQSMTEIFDFSIIVDHRHIRHFSVKTVGSSELKYFGKTAQRGGLECQTRFVCGEDEANIFLYDCSCDVCLRHPTRRVDISADVGFLDELQSLACRSNDSLANVLGPVFLEMIDREVTRVEIYLTSGRNYYELRHALSSVSQKEFRGENFRLRDSLVKNLTDSFRESDGSLPADVGVAKQIETLRSRSCISH